MNHKKPGTVTIMVVEDEILIRMDISEYLRAKGYDVVEAYNVAEAIQIIDSGVAVSLLFTDVRMPGALNGIDLVRYVQDRYPQTKFLITSGHLPAGELPEAFGPLIGKPYSPELVLQRIQEKLDQGESEGHGHLDRSIG